MTITRFVLRSARTRTPSPAQFNQRLITAQSAFAVTYDFLCSIDGTCPLKIAAENKNGELQMVQLLVDSGANVAKDYLTWKIVSGPVADYLRSVGGHH
jgi:hypothetical protein